MDRSFVFLNSNDHQLIFSHQLTALTRQFRKQLAGCRMRIDRASGVVNISAPISKVDDVDSIKGAILRESYLKLGCSQVSLYCMEEHIWDYNWHESTHEIDMPTTTIERPAVSQSAEAGYVPLEVAAQAIRMSFEELMDFLESQSIPVIVRNRQPWAIGSDSARLLAESMYQQQLVQMGLEESETPTVVVEPEPAVAAPAATAGNNGSLEAAAPNNVIAIKGGADTSPELSDPKFWQMPEGFNPKANARTPAKLALQNSLMSLPLGDRFYLERLNCLTQPRKFPEAKQFLENVSSFYSGKPDWSKAIADLKKEYNSPKPAA